MSLEFGVGYDKFMMAGRVDLKQARSAMHMQGKSIRCGKPGASFPRYRHRRLRWPAQ